uniref:RABL2 n=1 Tax=Gefionella okellyi TaxID=2853422 RepID=A0A125SEA2_9EUKA|nr:RABL2 [Gefionella okellyi]|eukprot:TRINITY_DN2687_c0_g1_i1.p1 TRINITY_DN2687_c0_g1~~TRINITY_DN2687_c0_g1_i1.p1  ORF type:complete len:209 (-),score=41.53 TRINITY_DN2687_c0_g1_i1:189-815(-)
MAGKQSDAGGDPRELEARADNIKVILLGDSAVGKSKLVERFMMDAYHPQQLSTYALTLFEHNAEIDGRKVKVDFWDTAGQERFNSMHPSYYYKAHVCLLVFDVTRKVTYKNLSNWYKELQEYRKGIPVIVVANKIDVDYRVTQKTFNFAVKHGMPFFFASASDGTNVVKMFQEAIRMGLQYKENPPDAATDFIGSVMSLLDEGPLIKK